MAVNRLDLVVEEDSEEEEKNKLSGVCMGFDQTELEQVLNEFQSVRQGRQT